MGILRSKSLFNPLFSVTGQKNPTFRVKKYKARRALAVGLSKEDGLKRISVHLKNLQASRFVRVSSTKNGFKVHTTMGVYVLERE